MKACVFFGHRKGNYKSVESKIYKVVIDLIEREKVTQFYAGGRGALQAVEYAKRKGKSIVDIFPLIHTETPTENNE